MTHDELEKLPEKARDTSVAITVEGKPSFCWGLAADKVVPPVLDPFFKENQITMKNINKIFQPTIEKYQKALQAADISVSSIVVAGEDANNVLAQAELSNAEKEELLNAV